MHGKGPSIWDTFCARPRNIFQGHHGQVSCDFYHSYPKDLELLRQMNISNFRFSLSWPRILPNGKGQVAGKGLDFYDRLIDTCLSKGITPWVTLYHWDLPQALQDKGGWKNRAIVDWFSEYVAHCARRFGDRVSRWMVLNEPMVFTGAGYFLGVHAPGEKGLDNFLPAVHHAVLCQAAGGRVLRTECPGSEIGTTFSCSYITPWSSQKKDIEAAARVDALLNRLFLEPALGLGYPMSGLKMLRKIDKYVRDGDMEKACFNFDFIGLQNYTREVVAHSFFVPYIRARLIKPAKRNVPVTLMDWEVFPKGISAMIRQFSAYPGVRKIIVSENGAAFEDQPVDGCVHDPKRVAFLQEYIKEVYRARSSGSPVEGYFVWTFLDNFEWAEGYYPRFGLVYTDFVSQRRIVKSSGLWFSSFLAH